MAGDIRRKNAQWNVSERSVGNAQLGLLMDIRDELQTIVTQNASILALLNCSNTLEIPHTLKRIDLRLRRRFTPPKA